MNIMRALTLETMGVTIGSYETIDNTTMIAFYDRLKAAYPKAPRYFLIQHFQ
jgi:hypothetical protein